jgi:hypothetical protein
MFRPSGIGIATFSFIIGLVAVVSSGCGRNQGGIRDGGSLGPAGTGGTSNGGAGGTGGTTDGGPSTGPVKSEPATAVVTGSGHSCALLKSGTVRCWGSK